MPIAIIAGIFTGYYQLDTLSDAAIAELLSEAGSIDLLIVISAVQTAVYALFCGFFGCILSEKLGLWNPVCFETRNLLITLSISVVGGIVFSLDHWVFGSVIDGIQSANLASLTVSGVIAAVLYGGIIYAMTAHATFHVVCKLIWIILHKKRDARLDVSSF